MKKMLCLIFTIAVIFSLASCSKNDSPAAASSAATQTPTSVSLTPSPTPKVNISAFINGVNSEKDYWITVNINNALYQYATITVNEDTLIYNGSDAYEKSGATAGYTAGIVYSVLIETEYGDFLCERTGPGGDIALAGNTVTYQYEGNSDFLFVKQGASVIYNSMDFMADIDSGFEIPGSAFPDPGDYSVSVYPYHVEANAFTGPVVPNSGDIMIEALTTIAVTK